MINIGIIDIVSKKISYKKGHIQFYCKFSSLEVIADTLCTKRWIFSTLTIFKIKLILKNLIWTFKLWIFWLLKFSKFKAHYKNFDISENIT